MDEGAGYRIFLSYRRADSGGYTGWLHELLAKRFSDGEVFRDVAAIEGGEKWVDRLDHMLAHCDVVLAVIGPKWLTASNERGRRLDDPEDRVRLELEAGVRREVPLIPVLVGGAKAPSRDQLPESLAPLCDWQAVRLSDESWDTDLEKLSGAIERAIQAPPGELKLGATFARHRIEALLGRGGMAVVYSGRHLNLNRVDAIKVIAPELARQQGFRQRFERESRIAASIRHSNVLTVYDAGQEDGLLYLSMQLVEGQDLATLLQHEGPLSPERAARIVAPVATALQAAHEHGLVHRDVKPANILVDMQAGVEHVYLGDFGIARETSSATGLTATGHWVGTADYVSPEQVMGQAVDGRADIYSLGCVLFEMLCGQLPYGDRPDTAKLVAHATQTPPSICELRPELPAALGAVVHKAMARDPDERYASASELRDAVLDAVRPAPAGAGSHGADMAASRPSVPVRDPYPVADQSAAPVREPAVAARALRTSAAQEPSPGRVQAGVLGGDRRVAVEMVGRRVIAGLAPARAVFKRRMQAALVDGVIAFVVLFVAGAPAEAMAGKQAGGFVGLAAFAGYYVLLEGGRRGQTVGKRIFNMRVVDALDGGPIGYKRALVRFLGRLLSALPLWLGYWWMLLDPQHQTWHDKLAKDLVLEVR